MVAGSGCPVSEGWNELVVIRSDDIRGRRLVRRLLQADVVQPDDLCLSLRNLRVIAMVRFELMWLEVPVDHRVRMFGISFVHVLRRKRRRQCDAGHQDRTGDYTPP